MKGTASSCAANDFEIIKEGERAGWIECLPLSVAAFGKKRGADGIPEINTLYCDMAYLKCRQADQGRSRDLDGRKIVAAELHADPDAQLSDTRKGRIRVQNNRRTLDLNDDIELVTPGPGVLRGPAEAGPAAHLHVHRRPRDRPPEHRAAGARTARRPASRPSPGVGLRVFLTPEDQGKRKPPAGRRGSRVCRSRGRTRSPALDGVERSSWTTRSR